MAILVEAMQQGKRDLLLEFDLAPGGHRNMPERQRFQVPKRRLIECIQNAIRAGWNPESRGKRFTFTAGKVTLD